LKTLPIQTALVTGGGSGMGQTIALELCRLGITVFVADRDSAAAEKTVRTTDGMPGRAKAVEVDVSQSDSVSALFGELQKKAARLDLLVHTAAILGQTAPIEDIDDQEWHRVMAVNLDGAFFCCREAVRWMKMHQTGRIILFSSVAAFTPTPGALPYSVTKGGVNMLGRTLAQEVAKYNIRVNIIAPGYVRTPMLNGLPAGFADYVLKKTPLRRFGDTKEIAGLVVFLSSPEADFFTGQIFSPNGGLVI
jgi:NAD(P)-dependent dehydrogenase (short-subunit alcohol dehydrogenase family)